MSRLTELKKQYPELDYSILDFLVILDKTNRYKYLPLLCKLFKNFIVKENSSSENYLRDVLKKSGINDEKISSNKILVSHRFAEILGFYNIEIINNFINYMENNQIEKKDVTSYETFEEINRENSKAELKLHKKSLLKQVHIEYEDYEWLIIRPLSFESSCKYGASTKWCTTSETYPKHFVDHWKRGILVYFLNKITGYKFAGFKDLGSNEISFWDQKDNRVDSLELEIGDFMYSIIKKIFNSNSTNESLSSDEIKELTYKLLKFNESESDLIPVAQDEIATWVRDLSNDEIDVFVNNFNTTTTSTFISPNSFATTTDYE